MNDETVGLLHRPNEAQSKAEFVAHMMRHESDGNGNWRSDLAREAFEKVMQQGGELVGEFEFSMMVKKAGAKRNRK